MKTAHARVLDVPPVDTADSPASPVRLTPGKRLRAHEDAWCRSHPENLLRFAGQWVAVEGERIVAHGGDPVQVVRDARHEGVRIPYVFFVETPSPGVVKMGL